MITSAGPAEGKSFTSLAIARHFANLGRRVLLVDADLRNPSMHTKLGRDNAVGLSNYLTGNCTPPEAMQKIEIDNLAFIASGPLPPNAADLLGGARLVSLLSIGSEVFDLIVIDGPPVMGLADALLLSSAASGTLFVVGSGKTRKRLIRGALRRLQLSRGIRHRGSAVRFRCEGCRLWIWIWCGLWLWLWLRWRSSIKSARPIHQRRTCQRAAATAHRCS